MSDNRTITVWRDPYGAGFNTTRAKKVVFTKGTTILVGCNGSGKTTLLQNIEDELRKADIPVFMHSPNTDLSKMIDRAMFEGNFGLVGASKSMSEGENISLVFSQSFDAIRNFIATGKKPNKTFKIFSEPEKEITSNERWILLDAIDSGYSIDNIVQLKTIFNRMHEDANTHNVDLYIIASANTYELARNSNCLDVMTGKNVHFDTYEEYRNFILKTQEKKEKRYKKETK